jgi:hypothetical protein
MTVRGGQYHPRKRVGRTVNLLLEVFDPPAHAGGTDFIAQLDKLHLVGLETDESFY